MILTNKQAMILLQIAIDSLDMPDNLHDRIYHHPKDIRREIIDKIFQQQGDKLIDLDIKDAAAGKSPRCFRCGDTVMKTVSYYRENPSHVFCYDCFDFVE